MSPLNALIPTVMIIGLVVTASAQEVSPPVVKGLNAVNASFIQNWNKKEPIEIAALFTTNSLFVAPAGTYAGRPGVQQYYEKIFPIMHPSDDFAHDIDHVQMLSGDLAMAVGHWSVSRPPLKGFWSAVYEHQGKSWLMRAHTYNTLPPPPATQEPSTSNR